MELVGTGTATLVQGVQQTIATIVAKGVYVFIWDMSNLTNDLTVEINAKVLSAGSEGIIYQNVVAGAAYVNKTEQSDPIVVNFGGSITMLAANGGGNINVAWRLIKLSEASTTLSGTAALINNDPATLVGAVTVPGVYVCQVDLSFAFGGLGISIALTVTNPASGVYYNKILTAAPVGLEFFQLPPLVCVAGAEISLARVFLAGTTNLDWSFTKVS